MVSCPACGTEVNSEFGIKTCPKCSLVFMVDMDGNASMPDAADYSREEDISASDDDLNPTQINSEMPTEDGGFSGESTAVHSEVYGDQSEIDSSASTTFESTEIHTTNDSENNQEYNPDFMNASFGDTEATEMTEHAPDLEEQEPETDGPKDPLGVQKFDRNAASQLVDGPYYYDLYINGLDTAQIKDEVLHSLNDKRFQWSREELKSHIRNGRLVFKDLNPVKAVLIVIKLQHIDVEIEWQQKLHTDPSVGSGTPGQI